MSQSDYKHSLLFIAPPPPPPVITFWDTWAVGVYCGAGGVALGVLAGLAILLTRWRHYSRRLAHRDKKLFYATNDKVVSNPTGFTNKADFIARRKAALAAAAAAKAAAVETASLAAMSSPRSAVGGKASAADAASLAGMSTPRSAAVRSPQEAAAVLDSLAHYNIAARRQVVRHTRSGGGGGVAALPGSPESGNDSEAQGDVASPLSAGSDAGGGGAGGALVPASALPARMSRGTSARRLVSSRSQRVAHTTPAWGSRTAKAVAADPGGASDVHDVSLEIPSRAGGDTGTGEVAADPGPSAKPALSQPQLDALSTYKRPSLLAKLNVPAPARAVVRLATSPTNSDGGGGSSDGGDSAADVAIQMSTPMRVRTARSAAAQATRARAGAPKVCVCACVCACVCVCACLCAPATLAAGSCPMPPPPPARRRHLICTVAQPVPCPPRSQTQSPAHCEYSLLPHRAPRACLYGRCVGAVCVL